MNVLNKDEYNVPVFNWCTDIEENAMKQIETNALLPFLHKRIVILPDCHMGYGVTIGSVLATKDVILPNAVGSDIGCGMCAVKTSLTDIDTETLKKIMGEIRKVIPVGFNKHKEKQDENLMPMIETGDGTSPTSKKCGWVGNKIITDQWNNALKSLGTLGGGNHFIEIQKGDDGHIWIMIHSGSRNLGKQVCDYYKKLAYDLNHKWHSKIPEDNLNNYLGFFPVDSEEGQAYIREMNYCVDFALANRKLMMSRILDIFHDKINFQKENDPHLYFTVDGELINIAHNYASQENHFGQNVWVHRKGATQAKKGQLGIIPGSQGTSSYIVEGLGNPDSFESCSHGAGRVMGRKQAERELDLEKEIKILDDQNIIHGIRHKSDLDEATSCYKNISEVMDNQKDLVKVLVKLKPLAVVKG